MRGLLAALLLTCCGQAQPPLQPALPHYQMLLPSEPAPPRHAHHQNIPTGDDIADALNRAWLNADDAQNLLKDADDIAKGGLGK